MDDVMGVIRGADGALSTARNARENDKSKEIFTVEGKTWYDDGKGTPRVLGDGIITVTHVNVSELLLHTFAVEIRRNGSADVYRGQISMDLLESDAKFNAAVGGAACTEWRCRNKDGSTAAMKSHLHSQEGAKRVVHDILSLGWVERFGIYAGKDGLVDGTGKWTRWEYPHVTVMCGDGVIRSMRKTENPSKGAPEIAKMEDLSIGAWRDRAKKVVEVWHDNLGSYAGAVGLGYMLTAMTRQHYIGKDRTFPHLYLHGKTQCGKDTFARILHRCVGVTSEGVLSAGRGTTEKAIRNALGDVGGWPLWLNELRQGKEFEHLLTPIRTSFDMQGSSVLTRDQRSLNFPARRSMILVGEAILGANAEINRYVLVQIKPPKAAVRLRALEQCADDLCAALPAFLANHAEIGREVQACYEKWYARLSITCDYRRARGYALVGAMLSWIYCDNDEFRREDPVMCIQSEIRDFLLDCSNGAMEKSEELSTANDFNGKAELARSRGDLVQVDLEGKRTQMIFVRRIAVHGKGWRVGVWLKGAYDAVERTARNLSPYTLVLNDFTALAGFTGASKARFGEAVRSVLLYEEENGLPHWLTTHREGFNEEQADVLLTRQNDALDF